MTDFEEMANRDLQVYENLDVKYSLDFAQILLYIPSKEYESRLNKLGIYPDGYFLSFPEKLRHISLVVDCLKHVHSDLDKMRHTFKLGTTHHDAHATSFAFKKCVDNISAFFVHWHNQYHYLIPLSYVTRFRNAIQTLRESFSRIHFILISNQYNLAEKHLYMRILYPEFETAYHEVNDLCSCSISNSYEIYYRTLFNAITKSEKYLSIIHRNLDEQIQITLYTNDIVYCVSTQCSLATWGISTNEQNFDYSEIKKITTTHGRMIWTNQEI